MANLTNLEVVYGIKELGVDIGTGSCICWLRVDDI